MDKKKKARVLIISIVLFLVLVLGGVYAWITYTTGNVIVAGNTHCFNINYVKGNDITGNIGAIKEDDYLTGNTIKLSTLMGFAPVSLELDKRCNKVSGIGVIELNVESLSNAYTSNGNSYGSLKYVVAEYDPTLYTDSTLKYLKNQTFRYIRRGIISETGTMDIHTEYLYPGEVHNYLVIIYVDKNLVGDDIVGANITATVSARADQFVPTPLSDFTYYTGSYNGIEIPEGKVLLVSYNGSDTTVNVPNTYTINGVTYKTMVFSDTSNNTSTFSGNTNITEVNFANRVSFSEYDGEELVNNSADGLFKGCTSLVNAPKMADTITSMDNTFEGCTSLTNVQYVPSNVTSMLSTFKGCTNLEGYIRISSESVVVDTDTFDGTTKNIVVEAPANSITYTNVDTDKPNNVTVVPIGKLDTSTPYTDFLYVLGDDNNSITSLPLYVYSDCINNDSGGDVVKSYNYDYEGTKVIPLYSSDSSCPGISKEIYNYTLTNSIELPSNYILLTGYTGSDTDIDIPDTYTINGVTYNVIILSSLYLDLNSGSGGGGTETDGYDFVEGERKSIITPLKYDSGSGNDDFCPDCETYGLLSHNPTLETVSIGDNVMDVSYDGGFFGDNQWVETFANDPALTTISNLPVTMGFLSDTFMQSPNITGTIRIKSCNVNLHNAGFSNEEDIILEVPAHSNTACSANYDYGDANQDGSHDYCESGSGGTITTGHDFVERERKSIFTPLGMNSNVSSRFLVTPTSGGNITVVEFENDYCEFSSGSGGDSGGGSEETK